MLNKITSLLILFILIASSCKKSDDTPSIHEIHKRLYDKTWYSVDNNMQPNHYFSSDGTFIISPNTGNWQWRPNDTLLLIHTNNSLKTRIWITKLEDDRLEYWPVWEPEDIRYIFSTTKP